MRWLALVFLLLPRVAAADDLVFRPHTQAVADPDGKADVAAVDAAIKNALPMGEIACAGAKGKLLAWVVLDGGRVASVDVGGTKDKAHAACVATGLKKIAVAGSTGRVVAVVELVGGGSILSSVDKIDLSKVGKGTGVGTGTGTMGKGPGGGGNVEGDYVSSKGPISTGGARVAPSDVKVEVGEPRLIKAELTAEEVSRVVRSRAGVFRACYQKELNRNPDLAGKLDIAFAVNAEGTVSKAEVGRSTMTKGDAVADCVRSNILRLKFPPKVAGGIAIALTFSKS